MDGRVSSTMEGQAAAERRDVLQRWVPAGLRRPRTDPGRRGAVALVVVALLAALAAGAYVWHGRPQSQAIPPPSVVSAPRSASPSAGSPSLVVAVTGKVRRPGVVTVAAGARVIDVLKAAGGPLPGADLGMLNLARKVTDGELVAVGIAASAPTGPEAGAPAPTEGAPGAAPAGPVDVNTATAAQLDALPGVGPVLAQRILDARTAQGGFTAVSDLRKVDGIGDARYEQLKDLVVV